MTAASLRKLIRPGRVRLCRTFKGIPIGRAINCATCAVRRTALAILRWVPSSRSRILTRPPGADHVWFHKIPPAPTHTIFNLPSALPPILIAIFPPALEHVPPRPRLPRARSGATVSRFCVILCIWNDVPLGVENRSWRYRKSSRWNDVPVTLRDLGNLILRGLACLV